MVLLALTMGAFTLVLGLAPQLFILLAVAGGSMGLGASGIPAIIEFAIECTYPMPEGTVMVSVDINFSLDFVFVCCLVSSLILSILFSSCLLVCCLVLFYLFCCLLF